MPIRADTLFLVLMGLSLAVWYRFVSSRCSFYANGGIAWILVLSALVVSRLLASSTIVSSKGLFLSVSLCLSLNPVDVEIVVDCFAAAVVVVVVVVGGGTGFSTRSKIPLRTMHVGTRTR